MSCRNSGVGACGLLKSSIKPPKRVAVFDPLSNTIADPNFTILVPWGCNANCDFCFGMNQSSKIDFDQWLKKLENTLATLPSQFDAVSISGGEPTMRPNLLLEIAKMIERVQSVRHFNRIVITTNGYTLSALVDFAKHVPNLKVNISRHSADDILNEIKFHSNTVPNANVVSAFIKVLNNNGVPVNFNCVTADSFDPSAFVTEYIQFAKSCGASSVAFRKPSSKGSDLSPSVFEQAFSHILSTHEGGCPACRTVSKIIDGLVVHFKSNVDEPSNVMSNVIYELIYNADGKLTKDWKGIQEVNIHPSSRQTAKPVTRKVVYDGHDEVPCGAYSC